MASTIRLPQASRNQNTMRPFRWYLWTIKRNSFHRHDVLKCRSSMHPHVLDNNGHLGFQLWMLLGHPRSQVDVPSGKQPHNYGKSPCLMGKLTISMAFFFIATCKRLPDGNLASSTWSFPAQLPRNSAARSSRMTAAKNISVVLMCSSIFKAVFLTELRCCGAFETDDVWDKPNTVMAGHGYESYNWLFQWWWIVIDNG